MKNRIQGKGYIVSESFDFWTCGGISALVCLTALCFAWFVDLGAARVVVGLGAIMLLCQAVFNWPHFMGAYSLLYRDQGNLRRYPVATIYVPLALLGVIALAWGVGSPEGLIVHQGTAYLLWLLAAFYLAWHYTGQAWGMMAVYARLDGFAFEPMERTAFRLCLRILLVWHVVWGAHDLPVEWLGPLHTHLPLLQKLINLMAFGGFLIGAALWYRIALRIGRMPDRRALIAWFVIYLWYLLLYWIPEAFLIVQFSHALQYVPFPLRSELNLSGRRGKLAIAWGLRYYLLLIAAGLLLFYLPERVEGPHQGYGLALMFACAISVHHYFVDSCIWHIRHVEVGRLLFAHLKGRHGYVE